MAEETSKELRDFQTVTNIRKITQEALAPVIKKIEGHMQVLIEECQQLKGQGKDIKSLIDMTNEVTARTTQFQAKAVALEEAFAKLSNSQSDMSTEAGTTREWFKIELQDLRKQLGRREEKHNALVKTQISLQKHLEETNYSLKDEIGLVQKKLGEVYRDTLNTTLDIKSRYLAFDNKLDMISYESVAVREQFTEANKKMQLYLTERQELYDKMEHLQLHIFGHVSVEQFDKYKKYQSVELSATVDMINAILQAALSKEVRETLPTVMHSLREIKKIAVLEAQGEEFRREFSNFDTKISEQFEGLKESFGNTVCEKVAESSHEMMKITSELGLRLEQLETVILGKIDVPTMDTYLSRARQSIYESIKRLQIQFDEKLERFVQHNRHHIYNAVESLIPQSEKTFWNKLKVALPRIEQIQGDVQVQCAKVTNLANGLQETLERFSNRITKIKTDLELKDENFATEIKFLKRSRQENERRIEIIGKLLSCQSEMIVLMATLHVHELALKKKGGLDQRLNQVFVSFSDGLIYELKAPADLETITYRKKSVGKLDLSCSALTCYLSVIDAHFEQEFLNWNKYRPSNFFRINMLDQIEHEKGKSAMLRNSSSKVSGPVMPQQPVHPHQLLNQFTNGYVQAQSPFPEASMITDFQAPSTVLDNMVNIVEVKDDSMEIFAKTTELRRREFSRHKKLDQRYIKSGAQTTRLRSANRTNLG